MVDGGSRGVRGRIGDEALERGDDEVDRAATLDGDEAVDRRAADDLQARASSVRPSQAARGRRVRIDPSVHGVDRSAREERVHERLVANRTKYRLRRHGEWRDRLHHALEVALLLGFDDRRRQLDRHARLRLLPVLR